LVEIRQAVIWTALLLAGQAIDVFTTAVDRTRGALESMPVSAHLLELGDIGLLWITKILLVTAAGAALFLTALWTRRNGPSSRLTFRFCLVAVQAATIGLTWVSLSNVALLSSL
jgi:hypothetical protein